MLDNIKIPNDFFFVSQFLLHAYSLMSYNVYMSIDS